MTGCELRKCEFLSKADGKCADQENFTNAETGDPCCRYHDLAIQTKSEANEITVTIEHLGYWRKQIARIRELAEDPNPSADEERAEIEAEIAAVFMQLIGE